MLTFLPTSSPQLYAAPNGDVWVALYLPQAPSPVPASIPLDQAFAGPGTFVFATTALDINASAAAIVSAVQNALQSFMAVRAMAWILDPANITAANLAMIGFRATDASQGYVQPGLGFAIVPNTSHPQNFNLGLNIGNGVRLALAGDSLTFTPSANNLNFAGAFAPQSSTILSATLPFSGSGAGAFQFTTSISRIDLYANLRWGFQLLFDMATGPTPIMSQWYPLADGMQPNGADMIGVSVSVDPADTTNSRQPDRTYVAFTGVNDDGSATILTSGYRSVFGDLVLLRPIAQPGSGEVAARLTLAIGNPNSPSAPDFVFGPEGDFILMLQPPKDGTSSLLLCGLTPTETLSFRAGPAANPEQGDRLRFSANRSAFALVYPPPAASTLGPPVDPAAPLIGDAYRTSWATIVRAPAGQANQYSAQPKGAPLFGFDTVVAPANKALLGLVDPGYALTNPPPFPLLPYGLANPTETGVSFGEANVGGVEQFVAAPVRRAVVASPGGARPARPTRMRRSAAATTGTEWATTPSGLLAELDSTTGAWKSVILGVNEAAGPMWMSFTDPPAKLQQALQTSSLFLVAANAANLGAFATSPETITPPAPTGNATFYNTMAVQDWQIQVRVGQSTAYGDYNNILIIKGVRGALVDLVSTPDVWTQSQDFSIPTSAGGTGDTAEIVVLSQWLANYLQAALAQTSPYFDNFKSIVIDEHWTGILVLKASLTDLPSNLGGLLSVIEPSQCFAHHFGITISPVRINQAANTPPIGNASSSSIFQLIYYVNPAVDPTQPIHVLPPTQQPYDFKLLTLKALFKNTSVKAFESYAQLTLDQFFGDAVDHMGDPANTYNTIMLTGAYQQQGGVGTFLLDSVADNLFFLNSAALNKAEIVRAQFNTINRTTLRFDLWGYLDFRVLAAVDDTQKPPLQDVPFDLFGFGSTDDPTAARQGLSFSTLGVVMDTSATPPVFAFDTRVISFDASRPRSTPRDGSIYQAFALNLRGLLSGDANDDPSAENYLTVPTTAPLSGVSGQPWYALEFDLNLGTIGALAGKAGLNARLITAWAPGPLTPPATTGDPTFYPAMVGLRLPGVTTKAKLLSLEGVLAISIGDIRLTYSVPNTQTTSRYWVLWLSDIALKFLGLLKIPPNGAVSFACFGNPQSGGEPTALGWYAVYNQNKPKSAHRALSAPPR